MWVAPFLICIYGTIPLTRTDTAQSQDYKMVKHDPCEECYSDQTIQDCETNTCLNCARSWCHMCNTVLRAKKTFCFDTFEHSCWGDGLGPGMCKWFHFLRFRRDL